MKSVYAKSACLAVLLALAGPALAQVRWGAGRVRAVERGDQAPARPGAPARWHRMRDPGA